MTYDIFHVSRNSSTLRMFMNSKNEIYLEIIEGKGWPKAIVLSKEDAKSLEIRLANLILKMP